MSMSTFSRPVPKDGDVGKVTTPAVIENNYDVDAAAQGLLAPEAIRRVEVGAAVVDERLLTLALPTTMIRTLGLRPTRRTRLPSGSPSTVYSAVNLIVHDRPMPIEPRELPDGSPVTIGRLPLLALDLVPDREGGISALKPAHGDDWIIDLF